MKLLLLAALAGVTLSSGGAALAADAQSHPDKACFFVRDVGHRTVGGPHTLYFKIEDKAHMHALAYYRVETNGLCTTQDDGFNVSIWGSAAGASAQVCSQKDLRISSGTRGDCDVASFTRMTPSEVAALPRRIRP